eukprot:1194999-Prorocentrum_minimum.AAC.3
MRRDVAPRAPRSCVDFMDRLEAERVAAMVAKVDKCPKSSLKEGKSRSRSRKMQKRRRTAEPIRNPIDKTPITNHHPSRKIPITMFLLQYCTILYSSLNWDPLEIQSRECTLLAHQQPYGAK